MRSLFFGCILAAAPLAFAQTTPAWWMSRGLLNGPSDDYSAANIGQLKYVASLAASHMDLRLAPVGAGTAIHLLVDLWSQPQAAGDDFSAVNVGQLKSVAKLFHDRLGLSYPWTATASDDDDYAMVNLGQLKYAFSFPISSPGDADGDGMLDGWEATYNAAGSLIFSGDNDLDQLSNRAESLLGSNPSSAATSGGSAAAALSLIVYSP